MADPRRTAPRTATRAAAAPSPARGTAARAAPTSRRAAAPAADPIRTNLVGRAGLEQALRITEQQEAERAARKDMPREPFRYFTPPGTTGEVIVVDEIPSFFRNEHALHNPRTKRYDLFVPCIATHAICPACAASDKPAYFAMYLTVIDLAGYENRQREWVEYSKKLLVVKPMQQKKFMRLYDRNNTMRGMHLEMIRDRKEDAVHGEPELLGWVEENDLLAYETDYVDQDNNVIPVICHEPFDYEAIYPDMSERQLMDLVGGSPVQGSRAADDRALDRRPASRTGRAQPTDDWEDEPPSRGSARSAPSRPAPGRQAPSRPAPAPRGRREEIAPEDDPANYPEEGDVDPEAVEEAAPRRAAPRAAPAAQARPVARPSAPARPAPRRAPAPEAEEAPAPRVNVAARRASLRR